jgi:hypothetical protein
MAILFTALAVMFYIQNQETTQALKNIQVQINQLQSLGERI